MHKVRMHWITKETNYTDTQLSVYQKMRNIKYISFLIYIDITYQELVAGVVTTTLLK